MKFQISLSELVQKLKEAIKEKQGIDPAVQYLIFGGKKLEDGRTLRQYGLGPDTVVHLGGSGFGSLPCSLADGACGQPNASTVVKNSWHIAS